MLFVSRPAILTKKSGALIPAAHTTRRDKISLSLCVLIPSAVTSVTRSPKNKLTFNFFNSSATAWLILSGSAGKSLGLASIKLILISLSGSIFSNP